MSWGPAVRHIPNLNAKCNKCDHPYGNHKYWWFQNTGFGYKPRGKCKSDKCSCLQYSSKYSSIGDG